MKEPKSRVKKLFINDVSRQVNLSQKRIREYEKEGLIKPLREPNTNNRVYTDFDVLQIERIHKLIHEEGFTVPCLKKLLVMSPCWNVFDCRQKKKCPAYKNPHIPCYETAKKQRTHKGGTCEHCAIYLNRDVSRAAILKKQPRQSRRP